MIVARDINVEFDAAPEDVSVVVVGMVEWVERRLNEEKALGRIGEYSVRVSRVETDETARENETILRWIEAGFPPWGCENCRGGEYGPDGVPCPMCHGHSDQMEPPARAQAIYALVEGVRT